MYVSNSATSCSKWLATSTMSSYLIHLSIRGLLSVLLTLRSPSDSWRVPAQNEERLSTLGFRPRLPHASLDLIGKHVITTRAGKIFIVTLYKPLLSIRGNSAFTEISLNSIPESYAIINFEKNRVS